MGSSKDVEDLYDNADCKIRYEAYRQAQSQDIMTDSSKIMLCWMQPPSPLRFKQSLPGMCSIEV